jgi:hypothetical protein
MFQLHQSDDKVSIYTKATILQNYMHLLAELS